MVEGRGLTWDVAPAGQYLLSEIAAGDKVGIYEYSISEKKCMFGGDGKSFLYAVPSRCDVTVYRQNWQSGNSSESLKLQ